MTSKKYSIFYSYNTGYTVNINKEHVQSVKEKGEMSMKKKNYFNGNGNSS